MDGFSFLISIRGSRWSDETTGASFTADYSIFIPRVFEALHTYKQPKHPSVYNCVFGQSISGKLQHMPWEIFDNTDIQALRASVSAQIKEECIDAFAKIATLEDVKTGLINGLFAKQHHHVIGLAILCAEMGDMMNAKRYLNEAINDEGRTQGYRDEARIIARRYNLS